MKKVLVVEDHADIRRLIRMTLEFEDCDVQEAASGRDGVQLAATFEPDLVLLDVMMPGDMDGMDVCRHLRAGPLGQRCRIVMLSARGMPADKERGLEAGADAYLVKPFSPLQLIQLMDELLDSKAGVS